MCQVSQITVPFNDTVFKLSVFQTACYLSAAIDVFILSCDTRNDRYSCELIVMFNFFFFFLLLEVVFDWWWIVAKLTLGLCKCELCNQYNVKCTCTILFLLLQQFSRGKNFLITIQRDFDAIMFTKLLWSTLSTENEWRLSKSSLLNINSRPVCIVHYSHICQFLHESSSLNIYIWTAHLLLTTFKYLSTCKVITNHKHWALFIAWRYTTIDSKNMNVFCLLKFALIAGCVFLMM